MKLEGIKDLLFIDVLGLFLVLVISLFPGLNAIRIILGIPFVLFFPGYTLVSALFPKEDDLDGVERFALSLGLSLALVPLVGLALNYTPFGIHLFPVTLSLYLLMLVLTGLTYFRRRDMPPEARFGVDFRSHVPSWGSLDREDKILTVASVILVVSVGVVGVFLASSQPGERFTEFYILGEEGLADDYPTDLLVGENAEVILGIKNQEHRTENYRVVLNLENDPITSVEDIRLNHGENWEGPLSFSVHEPGENMKLQALLYKGENAEPYRDVHLWLTVEEY